MIFFGTKLKFLPYKKKDFLIFDTLHFKYIKKCLNPISTNEYQIIHTRYESICLFVLFSVKFYQILFTKKKIKLAYFSGIIDFVKPLNAITFIDNNLYFYELSLIFKKTNFFSIQNSNHFLCIDKKDDDIKRYKTIFLNLKPKYYPVTYLSIGEYERFSFKEKCSFRFKKIIPVGSLATACRFYSRESISVPLNPSFDLGIIGNSNYCFKMGVDDNLMLSYVRELINLQKNLKVCYISKFESGSFESKEESIYINNFFNGRLIYKSKEKNVDTLDLCIDCNILVATLSAILREAYSVGVKILCLNTLPYRHSMVYDYISFTKFPEFIFFRNEINNLLKISKKEYFEKNDFKLLDLNTYEGKTAIENISDLIRKEKQKNN